MILEGQEGSRFEAQLRCDGTIADLATSLPSPIVASSLMQSATPVTCFARRPAVQRRSICTHHTEITAQHCKGASDKAPRRSIPLAAKSMHYQEIFREDLPVLCRPRRSHAQPKVRVCQRGPQ